MIQVAFFAGIMESIFDIYLFLKLYRSPFINYTDMVNHLQVK